MVDQILARDHLRHATEQYFYMVMFVTIQKLILTTRSQWMKPFCDYLFEIKVIHSYNRVVHVTMLHKGGSV